MKKIAWPYIGTPEAEMGSSDNFGNYRDIIDGSQERLDSMVPEKYTNEESSIPTSSYRDGINFNINNEEDYINNIFNENIDENSNLLFSSENIKFLEKKSSLKYNIYCLSKEKKNSNKIICEHGDEKYYNFGKKFDIFFVKNNNENDLNYILKNFYNQSKNLSSLFLSTKISENNIKNILKNNKILYSNISKINNDFYKISINNCLNSKVIGVLDNLGNTKAAFICDVAESIEDKINGLQAYSSIRNSFGLLFPYKRATDVSYHMGTVSYPIDIVFIDENSCIKKISRNIQPGDSAIFQCGGVKNVLEVKGGMCTSLDIKVGDTIFLDNIENNNKLDKKIAIKKSNNIPSLELNHGDVSIKIIGSKNNIVKTASNKIKNVLIVDVNDLFKFDVKLYKSIDYDKNNVRKVILSSPKTLDSSFKKVSAINFLSSNNNDGYYLPESINSFYLNSFEFKNSLKELLNFNGKIVFASDSNLNIQKISSLLSFKSLIFFNKKFPEFEVLNYDKKDGILYASENKYNKDQLFFLNKKAGIPVADDVKEIAKEAEVTLKMCKEESEELLKNLKKNLNIYQSVQSNPNAIKNSKFEYNESVKRNSEILKKILINIKKSLKLMNSIKDISNTFEIINSITVATMKYSEISKDIFDLVDIIENEDFLTELTKKTGELEKLSIDLTNSIRRMIDYINKDILGVLVITQ
jgi:uncharacterized membrane protein (UPF0127 family)